MPEKSGTKPLSVACPLVKVVIWAVAIVPVPSSVRLTPSSTCRAPITIIPPLRASRSEVTPKISPGVMAVMAPRSTTLPTPSARTPTAPVV